MKMQDDIAQREVALKNDQRVIEQNSKLAKELERRRTDHERKEREIQRICEESEELKELERRLKVAYMNKERAAQHEERLLVDSMEQQRVVALTSPHVRHVDAHTSLAAARFSPHPSTPYATAPPPASPAYASLPTYHQRQSPAPLYGGAYAYSPR